MAARPRSPEPRSTSRLYLLTPEIADDRAFAAELAQAVAAADIAAVLLQLVDADERTLINRIKALAPVAQDRGAALLIGGHAHLVARAGADGAHLTGPRNFRDSIEALKPDRIAGCGGLKSRHDAMAVAEAGADYVMFGEPDGGIRPGISAVVERVAWWAEIFETPCVGFAASPEDVSELARAGADFVAADFIWSDPRGVLVALADAADRLRLTVTAS